MDSEISKAAFPHQLLIINLIAFNLFFPMLSLLNQLERSVLPISLGLSLSIIAWIYFRAKTIHQTPLINAHWHIVWKRCRVLLIAYCISVSIEGLGSLMASFNSDPQMTKIMMIAFSRIAIIPTLLVVTPLLIMSTIAMTKVQREAEQTK